MIKSREMVMVNLPHLESRLVQSGNWPAGNLLDQSVLLRLLHERFSTVEAKKSPAAPDSREGRHGDVDAIARRP